jgi:hypothetical protein
MDRSLHLHSCVKGGGGGGGKGEVERQRVGEVEGQAQEQVDRQQGGDVNRWKALKLGRLQGDGQLVQCWAAHAQSAAAAATPTRTP